MRPAAAIVLLALGLCLAFGLAACEEPASEEAAPPAETQTPEEGSGTDPAAAEPEATAPAPPARPAWADRTFASGVVACDHPLASQAGREMLERGGNAVDAAVAASFALSVVRPYSCGIGGGGFMLVYLHDDPRHGRMVRAIDYRERAPGAVGPTYFVDRPEADPRFSGHAVAVPGTVAGLLHALETYGTMDRATVMAPAIRLAREGFEIDAHHVATALRMAREIDPAAATPSVVATRYGYVWRNFLTTSVGVPLRAGDRLVNEAQAAALERIALDGRAGFYAGETASRVATAVQSAGGVLTLADLAAFEAVEHAPISAAYGQRVVFLMPPPSSGGICAAQTLGILERIEAIDAGVAGAKSSGNPRFAHALVESFKHAFADRARWLGDAEYVSVPMARLLDPTVLARRAARWDPETTLPQEAYGRAVAPPVDGGTSHVSVVDAMGNAVACTETINTLFGSRVGVDGGGFVLNNQMDDFLTRPGEANAYDLVQAERNLPEPGKRPLSSMCPTIVLGTDGRVELVLGASGGPRIITATVQVLLNVTRFGLDAYDAVAAPRYHHQWAPNVLQLEPALTDGALADGLLSRGHEIAPRDEVGVVQVVRRVRGGWQAASDPRKGGAPAGH